MSRPAAVLVLGPSLTRAEIPGMCQLLGRQLARCDAESDADVVVCDLSTVTRPDLVVVEALARLRLVTIRYGARLHIRGAVPQLRELLVLTGLDEFLGEAAAGLSLGSGRQPEQREQPGGVEERVDPDDPVA